MRLQTGQISREAVYYFDGAMPLRLFIGIAARRDNIFRACAAEVRLNWTSDSPKREPPL